MFRFNINKKATSQEKADSFNHNQECKNIKIIDNENIIDDLTNNDKLYHEFVIDNNPNLIKLFLDIDCNRTKIDVENIEIDNIIKDLSIDIFNYLKYSKLIKSDIYITDIYISYTRSTDITKYSYHIFYNNILVLNNNFKQIKDILKQYISNSENIFAPYIDLQVYRKNTQLRFINCPKSEDSNSYHEPYNIEKQNSIELTKDNVYDYSICLNNNKNIQILNIINNDDLDLNNLQINTNISTPYFIKYLLFSDYIPIIEKKLKNKGQLTIDSINELRNLRGFSLHQTIKIKINCFCDSKFHKNPFIVSFEENFMRILKLGNSSNCIVKIIDIEYKPSELTLCKFLVDEEYIKIIDIKNKVYAFWLNNMWNIFKLDEKDNNFLNYIYNFDILKPSFKDYFIQKQVNKLNQIINSLVNENNFLKESEDGYLLQFNNGYLNLKTRQFLKHSIETKHMFKVTRLNQDYTKEKKLLEDNNYRIRRNELLDILDKIILNNEDSREKFKCNLSSILYSNHKSIITFFVGQTNSGKTTVKQLICQAFGDNYVELNVDVYTTKISTTGPNALLSQINYKLVSFASESSKTENFKTVLIKQLTEKTINARQLYSKECAQKNHLSQFIDTNFFPSFDSLDFALNKRICVIKFESYFCPKNTKDKEIIAHDRIIYDMDDTLYSKIIDGHYNLPFIHLLINWFYEYHSNNISIKNILNTENYNHTEYDKEFDNFIRDNTIYIENDMLDNYNLDAIDKEIYELITRKHKSVLMTFSKKFKELIKLLYSKHEKSSNKTTLFNTYVETTIKEKTYPKCITIDVNKYLRQQ